MDVLVERDYTYDDCVKKIHDNYGDNINIMQTKMIKIGGLLGFFQKDAVEITFSVITNRNVINSIRSSNSKAVEKKEAVYTSADDMQERNKILQMVSEKAPEIVSKIESNIDKKNTSVKEDISENDDIGMLRMTISELAKRVSEFNSHNNTFNEHPNLIKLSSLLESNAFSKGYIDKVVKYVKDSLSVSSLSNFSEIQNKAFKRIASSIKIKSSNHSILNLDIKEAKFFILVGPTGVGKTTSLSKLAAYYLLSVSKRCQKNLKVQAVTIDNYRIGGWQQIQKYCEYMNIPLTIATSHDDLRKYVDEYKNSCDVVFIDTTGRSPNDTKKIQDMQRYFVDLDVEKEVFLTINASTQASDILQIMEQYKIFGYSSIIVTKLDETSYPGGLVSVLDEFDCPISYITTGQTVPSDISKATVGFFIKRLKGFDEAESFVAEHYFSEDNYINWR